MTLTRASIQNRQAAANQIDGYVSGEIAMPPPVVHRTQRTVATCSHLKLLHHPRSGLGITGVSFALHPFQSATENFGSSKHGNIPR